MDEKFPDDFFEPFQNFGNSWNEKDWLAYIKTSEREIAKFVDFYKMRMDGTESIDAISQNAGWAIDEDFDEESDFSDQPWTLLNHPVYIVSKSLMLCFDEFLERILTLSDLGQNLTWRIAKNMARTWNLIELGVSGLDTGDYLLARCNYKMAAKQLNETIALLSEIPEQPYIKLNLDRLGRVVFDLRELCLNLANNSLQQKNDL